MMKDKSTMNLMQGLFRIFETDAAVQYTNT